MSVLSQDILVVTSARIHWDPTSAPVPQTIHYKKMVTPVLVSEGTHIFGIIDDYLHVRPRQMFRRFS